MPDQDCPSFVDQVKADLNLVETNPIGKRLIEKIGKLSHKICIKYATNGRFCDPLIELAATTPGKGCSSIIWYSLSEHGTSISYQCEPIQTPRFVDLAHELIHGYLNGRGKTAKSNHCDIIAWSNDREYQVIMGLPSKKLKNRTIPKITENNFRIAQGLQQKFSHHCIEFLKDNPFIYSHVSMLGKVCLEKGFSDIELTSIKNLTDEDIKPIGGAVIFSRVYLSKGESASPIMEYIPLSELPEDMPAMTNFNLDECPYNENLKKLFPHLLKVDAVGIYKINKTEANWFIQYQEAKRFTGKSENEKRVKD
jgi:NleD-like pathogen effector protein (putative zinc metallopeptidase)